jgi:ubiquinol-cytochrome c reductase cytochrome c subunit
VTDGPLAPLSRMRRSRFAAPLLLFVALVSVGALYAALGGSGRASAAQATDTSTVAQGRELFVNGCSSCHGLNAQGGSYGPSLIGVGAAAANFQLSTGRMPLAQPGAQAERRAPQYSPSEISAIAAYIATLGPGPGIPTAADLDLSSVSDADMALGGRLFRTNCASCHNFVAEGGALSRGRFAPSMTGATTQQIWEAMLTGPENMPVFANTTLTPDDKREIIAYIKAVQNAPNPGGIALGRVGPVPEGAVMWVVGLGLLAGFAVWIGAKVS